MTPTFSIQYRSVIVFGDTINAGIFETIDRAHTATDELCGDRVGIYPLISEVREIRDDYNYYYRGFHIYADATGFHMVDNDAEHTDNCDEYHGVAETLDAALFHIDHHRYLNNNDDPGRKYKFYVYHRSRGRGRRYLAWQHPAWDESGYFWTSDFDDFCECLPNNTNEHPFLFDDPKKAIELIKELKINFACDIVVWDVSNEEIPEPTGKTEEFFLPGIAVEVGI